MTAFNPGDKVLLIGRWSNLLGTVRDTPASQQDEYTVDLLNNTSVTTVTDDEMELLPADAPLLRRGTRVRVHNETPRPATCIGLVASPEIFLDRVFGYWVVPDTGCSVWAPAAALSIVEAGEPS